MFENEDNRKDAGRILKVLETHFIGVTNETYEDTNSTHVPKRKVNPLILSYVQQEYFPGPVTLETYKTLFSVTI